MQNPKIPLPEKCCARCGFLHGSARAAASREDALFDPDLIRSAGYPPLIPTEGYGRGRGVVTSQAYPSKVGPVAVRNYTWADTWAICCYMNKFPPTPIEPIDVTKENPADVVPAAWTAVEQVIRRDRQDCSDFFEYHPGYTATQHVALRLEETKIQQAEAREKMRAEAFEKMLEQWSVDLEERLRRWSIDLEGRLQRYSSELEKPLLYVESRWEEAVTRLTNLGLILIGLEIIILIVILATR